MSNDFAAPSGPASAMPPPPPPASPPPTAGSSPPPPPASSPPAPAPPPPPASSPPTAGSSPPPPPASSPPPPPASPPPAPPPPASPGAPPSDIDELIARLHDEMDLEAQDDFDPHAPLTTPVDASRPKRAPVIVIESAGGIEFDPEIPSLAARFVGLAVDLAALVLFLLPGLLVARRDGSDLKFVMAGALCGIGFVGAMALYARGIAASGQWLGNRVAGTYVVDARNGAPLDTGRAAARWVMRFLMSPVFALGFLAALRDSQRRTFHDTAAGAVVTRAARETWSLADDRP